MRVAALASPQVIGHLQVRDFDPVRPTRLNSGFDGCPHVVDVNVNVPQPCPSDNHERITERAKLLSHDRHSLVGCVQQEHHFVGRSAIADRVLLDG